jgi:hypothetical protein
VVEIELDKLAFEDRRDFCKNTPVVRNMLKTIYRRNSVANRKAAGQKMRHIGNIFFHFYEACRKEIPDFNIEDFAKPHLHVKIRDVLSDIAQIDVDRCHKLDLGKNLPPTWKLLVEELDILYSEQERVKDKENVKESQVKIFCI